MKSIREFLLVILGPMLALLVMLYPYERREVRYVLPNFAIVVFPQLVWWLACRLIRWRTRNECRGPLFGGIVAMDIVLIVMLLPYFSSTPSNAMQWLSYYPFAFIAAIACGITLWSIGLIRKSI